MITSSRREFLKSSALTLAGFGAFHGMGIRLGNASTAVIEMRSDALGARVWFDPIGLFVEPGATVRWIVRANVHTTTAYHPSNDKHSLRIPEGATPWDSGYLVQPGTSFDVTLTVPGVYDYYAPAHFVQKRVRVRLLQVWRWLGWELLINASPRMRKMWENYLCFLVRGKHITWELEVVKK